MLHGEKHISVYICHCLTTLNVFQTKNTSTNLIQNNNICQTAIWICSPSCVKITHAEAIKKKRGTVLCNILGKWSNKQQRSHSHLRVSLRQRMNNVGHQNMAKLACLIASSNMKKKPCNETKWWTYVKETRT